MTQRLDYLKKYKQKIEITGTTPKERVEFKQRSDFERYLRKSPNREIIYIDEQSYEVVILSKKINQKESYLQILASLDVPLHQGIIIFWHDNFWLVTIAEEQKRQNHFKGELKKCNNILKWVDKYGAIKQTYCYIFGNIFGDLRYQTSTNGFGSTFSFSYASINGSIQIIIPLTEDTKNIKEEYQFILNNKKWNLTDIDDFSYEGLIGLLLKRAMKNPITDDLKEGLADADRVNSWKIIVENGNNYSLVKGYEQELEINLYNNDNLVTIDKPELEYYISDPNVIKFDGKKIKAIDNGKAILEICIKESPTIKTVVNIEVNNSPVINYHYNLTGNAFIKQGGRKYKYIASRMYNSEEDIEAIFNFSIKGLVTLATLEVIDRNSCYIITNNNNKYGKITLIADDGLTKQTKEIEIESLI